MTALYPTKARLALLRDVSDGYVRHRAGLDIDDRTRQTVTARMEELERAGWVEGGDPFWRTTDAGRAVLDAHGGQS